jgi:hypothetical protein
MRAAMAEAGRRGPSHGLLFCKPQIELLYARLGWTRRAGPVLAVGRDGRRGPLSSGDTAMTYRLRAAPFPEGELDLLGPRW